ncbi:MAG TPA: hypothetical protein VHM70_25855, partial [Polyangiaceae bacterium]|nr:hypothetical protein [Polyangiaceae bacterium]
IMGTVVFSDGAFYAAELRSTDGETWEAAGTPNSAPEGVAAGWLLSGTGTGEVGMQAWQPGDEPREVLLLRPSEFAQTAEGRPGTSIGVLDYEEDPPASVDVSFEDGADCVNSACVLIGSRLLLAPAPGTPPLPDHIARDANGNPLLSYDCPRSTQIHCDDYETRTGCVCDPEAPSIPEACPDVSNFECPARFTTRDSEFELDEVGPANCDCNFVDPNQPASFAEHCDDSSEVCSELFTCLDYSPPSFGPPPTPERICSRGCSTDADCPSWTATGYCGGKAQSPCVGGVCGPRPCTSNP